MDAGHIIADNQLKALESDLEGLYRQATREMLQKQKAFLTDYQKQLEKMKKDLKKGKITKEFFKKWQQDIISDISWYQEMVNTLAFNLTKVDEIAADMINGYLPNIYAENANFGLYEVENATGIKTAFSLVNHDTVKAAMSEDLFKCLDAGKDFNWNKQKLTSALIQGILQGEEVSKIAKRFKSVSKMDKNAAIRNARTSVTGAENAGRIFSYERAESLGIKVKKKWIATLDERTRTSHRLLDETSVDVNDTFQSEHGAIRFPADPQAAPAEIYNCRCTLVADIEGVPNVEVELYSKIKDYEAWKRTK